MLVVVVAWVPFRAESLEGTRNMLTGMVGFNGFALNEAYLGYLNKLAGLGDYLVGMGWAFSKNEFDRSHYRK